MLSAGAAVRVEKLRPDGSLSFSWTGEVLRCDEAGIVLRAEFNVDLVEREWGTLRRGDVFVEFYYWEPSDDARARNYNVFQVSSPDGTLKGWYCNLGLPARLDPKTGVLSYVDLALDVWAHPDGTFVVLDQDDLDEILAQYPELAPAAEQGRADLIELAHSRRLPRWPA